MDLKILYLWFGIVNAEQLMGLLQSRGWKYNPGMGAWMPPSKLIKP